MTEEQNKLAEEIERILAEYHRAVELDDASLLPKIMSQWCDLFFKPGASAILAGLREPATEALWNEEVDAMHHMADELDEDGMTDAASWLRDTARRLVTYRKAQPATDAVRLSDFVNAADIGGADAPHVVVDKLQAAIDRALKGKGASQGALHDKPLLRAHVGLAPEPSGEPSSEMGAISYAITLLETEHDWEKCLQYLRAVEDRLAPDEQKDRP